MSAAAVAERILVTGAAGFAGSHLVHHLAATRDVTAWARSTPPSEVAELATWQRVDLMDRAAVREAIAAVRPGLVFHCAGSPHVAASWQDSATPLASNVIGTHHLLDALHAEGVRARVLITGSATVYAPSDTPIGEDDRVNPVSPYALSKFAQERLGLRAVDEDGLEVIITRSFNHTGPRQTAAFVAPSMARQIALIERGALDPVIRVGNLDARRDLTDVRDVVRAYDLLARAGAPGRVYNVASGSARSMREILDGLLARASRPITVEVDPARLRPHDTPVLVGDSRRLREATGWRPDISFDRMLDDLLDWWRGAVATTAA